MIQYTLQHIRAKNDANGDPRRLYLVTALHEGRAGAFDEGYSTTLLAYFHGRHAVPEWLWDLAQHLPPVDVTAAEYKRLLRAGPATELEEEHA